VPELTEALRDRSRPQAERVAIVRAFRKLKAMSAVSVLRSVLAEPEASGQVPLLHAEALRTLGELAPAEAEPAARALLTNKSAFLQNEAVQVLGRKPAGARQLAEEFLERKLLWNVLQRLIEVLKRHADSDAKAAELVEALERESQRGLVREFWVVGPFGRPRDLRTVFPPERKPDPEATYTIGFGESRSWKEYKTQDNGLLRLPASLPRDRGFSYALAYVQAPTAGKVTMYLGAGEPVRVWVNDRLVHEADRLRVARLDEDRVEVSLKRGWNTVLVKLGSRDRSPSELYLRFLGDALRFSLKPEEK